VHALARGRTAGDEFVEMLWTSAADKEADVKGPTIAAMPLRAESVKAGPIGRTARRPGRVCPPAVARASLDLGLKGDRKLGKGEQA
jgi:hypothetical protein